MTSKRALRAELRAARDAFVADGPEAPVGVDRWLADRFKPGVVVASYVPIGSEAPPDAIEAAAWARGCRLALPYVTNKDAPLRFVGWRRGEALAAGPFGLLNPHPHRGEVRPGLVLTPLLGFDRRGNRLGQGAGHYDRAFADHPRAWRVGVAWSVQETDALVADPWDVPLHAIATEREWIMTPVGNHRP